MSDSMQNEFEAWHRSVVEGEPPHEKYNSGDYRNQHVQRYWLGWKASRESLVIELPIAEPAPRNSSSYREGKADGFEAAIYRCQEAIVAYGLKVAS